MMDLRWQTADPDLRRFVTVFIERRDCERLGPALELPLAVPQVQVMLGGGYRVEALGRMRPMPRAALWGGCADVRRAAPAGKLHAFVAVLTFRGAALLLGEAPRPIVGKVLDLESLAACAPVLVGGLVAAPAFAARIELFQDLLRSLAGRRREAEDGPILDLSAAIAGHRLAGSVADVARAAGLSERTLYNRLQRGIGLSPKRLLRLARLNRLLRSLHPAPWGERPPLDPLDEFFDEAHMHREFTRLTGLTPRTFTAAKARTGDRLVHSFLSAPAGAQGRMTG